jgi:hypothetical protein
MYKKINQINLVSEQSSIKHIFKIDKKMIIQISEQNVFINDRKQKGNSRLGNPI